MQGICEDFEGLTESSDDQETDVTGDLTRVTSVEEFATRTAANAPIKFRSSNFCVPLGLLRRFAAVTKANANNGIETFGYLMG